MTPGANSGACLACGGALRFFGKRRGYTYSICSGCATVQLSPVPTDDDLARSYRDEYAKAGHIARDPQASRLATKSLHASLVAGLQRHGAGRRVLDYGAGWGGLVIQLQAAGFDAVGYDLSEDMVAYSKREGLPLHVGGIDAVRERDLDAIVLASVFEHLNKPSEWLQTAHGLLRPGGLLITTQPTAPFARIVGNIARLGVSSFPLRGLHQMFCPPWHVALYSTQGMQRLVERAGFQMVDVNGAPQQREPGFTGVIQATLERINKAGAKLVGPRWPLFTGHNFVFRRL